MRTQEAKSAPGYPQHTPVVGESVPTVGGAYAYYVLGVLFVVYVFNFDHHRYGAGAAGGGVAQRLAQHPRRDSLLVALDSSSDEPDLRCLFLASRKDIGAGPGGKEAVVEKVVPKR